MENKQTGPAARWKYTPIPACGGTSPKGKHVTGFSGRFTPLQHGYHRLTGFSGCYSSPTNPVRWCNSSSFATPEGEVCSTLPLPAVRVILSASEESRYMPHLRQTVINTSRQEGAACGGFSPFGALRHHLRHCVKRVTRFSGRYAPLRIVFPCHPAERWDNNAPISDFPISTTRHRAAKTSPSGGTAI